MSVKQCYETPKLYILFVDKEYKDWGISVKTTWIYCKTKLKFYSQ